MRDASDGSAPAPLLDRAHLERETAGEIELASELLALFAEQCRRLLPAIADASSSRADRADGAHTLKGSALGIGAALVAERAGRLEFVFRTTERDPESEIAALAADIAATLAEIEKP